MVDSGPQAALRGYRLQSLYTLHRLLSAGADRLVFQLEGREDLDIYGPSGDLLEIIQIKAHSSNLTLHDLNPDGKRDQFFRRVLDRRELYVGASGSVKFQEMVVSFGPLGEDLRHNWRSDAPNRHRAIQKLENWGYTGDEASSLIESLSVTTVDEAAIEREVHARLRDSLPGCDPHAAFELLHAWLFFASEAKARVTPAMVIDRVTAVGRFIADRRAHHDEWFTSIVPLQDTGSTSVRTTMAHEFYLGVAAQYAHILAGVDVPRVERLRAIDEAFQQSHVVVVRGASGQGKSALAYRYLHDFVPETWRFEIRLIQDRRHAVSIARALLGHLDAVGAVAYILIDVAPADTGWTDLVRELAGHPSARLLIAVREEDWRRASLTRAALGFHEVELQFDEAEARLVYHLLVQKAAPPHLLTFEDAWARFGMGGPLLEFVHLVTQQATLRERLTEQVARLRDDVRTHRFLPIELDLLRRVAVASAYGGRLDLLRLVVDLGLPDARRTIELLEREYLIRVTPDRQLVDGLHPIRSTILADLLTDDALEPWAETARACLSVIVENDMESFLLHAFARRPSDAVGLRASVVQFRPRTWTGVAGIIRALLWLGISDYIASNRGLLDEAHDRFGSGWAMILKIDIGKAEVIAPDLFSPWWEELRSVGPELKQTIEEFRSRQTPTEEVFAHAVSWLAGWSTPVDAPATTADWAGAAEVTYWSAILDVAAASRIGGQDIARAVTDAPLEVAADVLFATACDPSTDPRVLDEGRQRLMERFRQETATVALEDDGQTIHAHFLLGPAHLAGDAGADMRTEQSTQDVLHDEAIRRVELLRRIEPEREGYGCQGYGHSADLVPLPYDPTTKTTILRRMLPARWSVGLNSWFIQLASYSFRTASWADHAREVLELRRTTLVQLERLLEAIHAYFRSRTPLDLLGDRIDETQWREVGRALGRLAVLPQAAVDEWGFVGEGMTEPIRRVEANTPWERVERAIGLRGHTAIALALRRHRPYYQALQEFGRSFSNFYQQAVPVLRYHPYLGRPRSIDIPRLRRLMQGEDPDGNAAHLSAWNLTDAVKALRLFQDEFRNRFAQYVNVEDLAGVDEREQRALTCVWRAWQLFAFTPRSILSNPGEEAARRPQAACSEVSGRLASGFKRLNRRRIRAVIVSETVVVDGERGLWVTFDIDDPPQLYDALVTVYETVKGAFPATSSALQPRHLAAYLEWPTVHLIPLFRGRALGRSRWRYSSLSLMLQDTVTGDDWWRFVPQAIPDQLWQELGIALWEQPNLHLMSRFQAAVVQFAVLLGQFARLLDLPDPDTVGLRLLEDYVSRHSARVSEALQEAFDSATVIVNYFNDLPDEERTHRPMLAEAMRRLLATHSAVGMSGHVNGMVTMNLQEVKDWLLQLKQALPELEAFRLCWVADVLDQTA